MFAKHNLIVPMSAEQQANQDAILTQLCEAEADAVKSILARETTPETLIHVGENARMFAEEMIKKYRHPNSPPVACKDGCYWCCYQAVQVTVPEVLRITNFIEVEMDNETRMRVKERLIALDRRTRGLTPNGRAKLHATCAFLRGGRCAIYAVRPFSCSEFTSFDVRDCKRGQQIGFKKDSVIHDKARMSIYYAVMEGMTRGLREHLPQADTVVLELTSAVSCALESGNAADQWLAGGRLFSEAHLRADRT